MVIIKNEKMRNIIRVVVPVMIIALVILAGTISFLAKKYLLVAFAIAFLGLALFITGYERKKVGTRRMVLVAVITALCIVGRFIPFFKPITALTVLAAVYLGGEAGFLVGALSALLSNFYFGQGPWTPFQMLAWGAIGLFAGLLAKSLRKSKGLLIGYGVLAGIIYSLVMDVWTVLWYDAGFSLELYKAAIITALPHTIMYAFSNLVFLWLLAKPVGDKLSRVKLKYGV